MSKVRGLLHTPHPQNHRCRTRNEMGLRKYLGDKTGQEDGGRKSQEFCVCFTGASLQGSGHSLKCRVPESRLWPSSHCPLQH